jgi:hypothetical protein
LKSNPSVGGVAITGGSAIVNVLTADIVESESSSSLGLSLGLTIPLGLLFLVGLIVIIRRINSRKNDNEEYEKYSGGNSDSKKEFG